MNTANIPQTLAADECDVLNRFHHHRHMTIGPVSGAIFVPHFRDCDAYLDAADQRSAQWGADVKRERSVNSPVARWTFPDTSTLTLDWIPRMDVAYAYAGRTYNFMAIHYPALWFDAVSGYMLSRLRGATPNVQCRLYTTRTPLVLPASLFGNVADPDEREPVRKPINYSQITSDLVG